jgi:hypothetical protein
MDVAESGKIRYVFVVILCKFCVFPITHPLYNFWQFETKLLRVDIKMHCAVAKCAKVPICTFNNKIQIETGIFDPTKQQQIACTLRNTGPTERSNSEEC